MDWIRRLSGAAEQQSFSADFDVDGGSLEHATGQVPHTLFAPLHYEPGYAYPLLIWLHGHDADERHLMRVMPMISMRNYVAIAPRGTATLPTGRFGWEQSEEHVVAAEQRVLDCLQIAEHKLHVASHRVFLGGFDSGGTMAFRVAMDHPRRFAGVLSLGGPFPSGDRPFRNLPDARKLSIFLAAGRDSTSHPPERVCDDLRLFHTAGLSVTLRQYPCGHVLMPQMLSDVDRWIIEQITRPSEPTLAAEANQYRSE